MNKDKEVIDLVPCKDGTYGIEEHSKLSQKIKPPYDRNNMDQLFLGMDAGMEFVEGMQSRVGRLMKLFK